MNSNGQIETLATILIVLGVIVGAVWIFPQIYDLDAGDIEIDEDNLDDAAENLEDLQEELDEVLDLSVIYNYAIIVVLIIVGILILQKFIL